MEQISSSSNPKAKLVRSLRSKKERDALGLFLCEGIHHVGVAFECGWDVQAAFYQPHGLSSAYGQQLVRNMEQAGVPVFEVSATVFESMTEKENTLGLLAVVRKKELSLSGLAQANIIAAMVSPQDPGNVGTVLRTLDAVGGGGLVLLDGGVDPWHPSVVRASMGSFFTQPMAQSSFGEFAAWAKQNSWQLLGTSARGQDLRTADLSPAKKIVLFGSEQKGLEPWQVEQCDMLLSVPMLGKNTSLNIGVAAGIILYKVCGLV